ncbi:hypothetical protein BDW62DRAFT_218682 [Aspergillus aurantiobrunneus]
MWIVAAVDSAFTLWCSDGKPIDEARGGVGETARIIVDQLGFLDITQLDLDDDERAGPPLALHLGINADATFTSTLRGNLKPLPEVSAGDAAFLDSMIAANLVPYPNTDNRRGKSQDEIRALGQQLFPFSPCSFQLAMAVYDWTTESFARMVHVDMFRYTGLAIDGAAPVDQRSLAHTIWTCDWQSYTAQNAQFMASLLMQPAWSEFEVELQLLRVRADLQRAVDVENRLLAAALQSLPRTSILSQSQLFSGQLDMSHLEMDNFGISFMECPANNGPIYQPLKDTLRTALETYLAEGRTITTKVTWSFTDSIEGALHYSNGIILVLNCSYASCVWETVSYVTLLSDDPKKIEYTVPPGSLIEVQGVDEAVLGQRQFLVLTLRPLFRPVESDWEERSCSDLDEILPTTMTRDDVVRRIEMSNPGLERAHTVRKTGGRRCACIG